MSQNKIETNAALHETMQNLPPQVFAEYHQSLLDTINNLNVGLRRYAFEPIVNGVLARSVLDVEYERWQKLPEKIRKIKEESGDNIGKT